MELEIEDDSSRNQKQSIINSNTASLSLANIINVADADVPCRKVTANSHTGSKCYWCSIKSHKQEHTQDKKNR